MIHGRVFSTIWTDEDFTGLNAQCQQLYLLLLSSASRSHAGVLPMTLRRWANSTADATADSVRAALMHLAQTKFVVIDWETEEVLVRTYIRNDGVYRQPNVMKSAIKSATAVESQTIRSALANEISRLPGYDRCHDWQTSVKELVGTPVEPFDNPSLGATAAYGEGDYLSNNSIPLPQPLSPSPNPPPSSGGSGGLHLVAPPVPAKQAPRRAPRTKVQPDYMPPKEVIAVIRNETGATSEQLQKEHGFFIDHWLKTGKMMADWDACWRNWMRTANERGKFDNGGLRGADRKVMEYEQLRQKMESRNA